MKIRGNKEMGKQPEADDVVGRLRQNQNILFGYFFENSSYYLKA